MPTQKRKRADADISPAQQHVKKDRHQTTQKRKHDAQKDQQEARPTKKAAAEHTADAVERPHARYREPEGHRKSRRIAGLLATSTEDTRRGSGPTPGGTNTNVDTVQSAAVDFAQNVEINVAANADVDDAQNITADQAGVTSLSAVDAIPRTTKTPDDDSAVPEIDPSEPTARVIAARKARIHKFLDVLSDNTVKYEFSDKLYEKAAGWHDLVESLAADTNLDETTRQEEIRDAQQSAQEFDDAAENL